MQCSRLILSAQLILSASIVFSGLARAQSDPQAVAALQEAIAAVGRVNQSYPVQDFTAQGTITYHWAGEQVTGPAVLQGRAPGEFRLEAQLATGARTYVLAHALGQSETATSGPAQLPVHNTVNEGVLVIPSLTLTAWLSDPFTVVRDFGMVKQDDGRLLHDIRLERHFPPTSDPGSTIAKLCVTDYYLDPGTELIAKIINQTHPDSTLSRSFAHEIDFENYTQMNGVSVPLLVREKIDGQTTWELQLTQISFNTGLSDAQFAIR